MTNRGADQGAAARPRAGPNAGRRTAGKCYQQQSKNKWYQSFQFELTSGLFISRIQATCAPFSLQRRMIACLIRSPA
jgi:hypothetical protein